MTKLKLIGIIALIAAMVVGISLFSACQAATPETVTVVETQIVTETSIVEVEVTAAEEGAYDYYEMLRGYASENEAYPDAPAAGHTLAFTNILGGIPFCDAVWQSVQDQWALAGGNPGDLYYADNQVDPTIGLKNAEIMLAKSPDVFINFQFDSKINSIISVKFAQAGIPIIAVDVPTPGAPFMGVNNFKVAYLSGEEAIKYVDKLGGIEMIDSIILMQLPAGGEVTMLRSEGFYQAFVDTYGADVIDPITIRGNCGNGEAEQSNQAMTDILSTIPDSEYFVLTSVNSQSMSGIISAIQTAGRWDPDKWIIITQGADETGCQQVIDGLTDGSIAYFPEKYGEYLIPASVALMKGEIVPPFMYVENALIDMSNMADYYPELLEQ